MLPFPVIIEAILRSRAHSLPAPTAMRRPNPPCHPACPERRREQSEGSAFLRSVLAPISSSVLSVTAALKMTPCRPRPEQVPPSGRQLSAVSCRPRFSRPLRVAAAARRTVLKKAQPLAPSSPPAAPASLLALLCKKSAKLSPVFSDSCALFKKESSSNYFTINKFHTLSQNAGG